MTRCAFPGSCEREAEVLAVFHNIRDEHVELPVCRPHSEDLAEGRTARRIRATSSMLAREMRAATGLPVRPIHELLGDDRVAAAHRALADHQEVCAPCAAVRDWIADELREGRIRGYEDQLRVGLYVSKHCCAEGLRLNEEAGRASLGIR